MKYTITTTARIPSGVLALSADQAKPRLHNLKSLGGHRYEIVNPVEFKSGETIGYEGDLPKNMATFMEDEGDKRKRLAAEEKAAKKLAKEQTVNAQAATEADFARANLVVEARAAWESDAELRGEWQGDLDAFLAAALQAG